MQYMEGPLPYTKAPLYNVSRAYVCLVVPFFGFISCDNGNNNDNYSYAHNNYSFYYYFHLTFLLFYQHISIIVVFSAFNNL